MAVLGGENLGELVAQKEREWKEVQHLRCQQLETQVDDLKQKYEDQKTKFLKLKDDFKYNLRLLSERDAELENYDSICAKLKGYVSMKDAEISELKIRLDDVSSALSGELNAKDELQKQYQQHIREKHSEVERYKCDKDADIQRERNDLESFKRNLDREKRELEEELTIQKAELCAGFDDAARRREQEYRRQMDEMSCTVLAHEMKVKLLTKELEALRVSQQSMASELDEAQDCQRHLDKTVKHKEWEVKDVAAMKDARILELETQLEHSETKRLRAQEDFERKHAELDRYVKERDAALAKVKDAWQEKEQELLSSARDQESLVEQLRIQLRQAEWVKQDAERQLNDKSTQLQAEIQTLKARCDSHIRNVSQSTVQKDVQIEKLKDSVSKLRVDLAQKTDDIERYRRQLATALEREQCLEQSRTQLGLDWQRRAEDLERQGYTKSEDLIRKLTKARDEAIAEIGQLERELRHSNDVTSLVTKERNAALVVLKQHGLSVNRDISTDGLSDTPLSDKDEVAELRQQNDGLRQIISQMRREMETLGDHMTHKTPPNGDLRPVSNDYVKNLEKELQNIKAKCRQLEQNVKDSAAGPSEVTRDADHKAPPPVDDLQVRAHMEQLNETIGTLRRDKVELTAHLRKQQARIQHLEKAFQQIAQQPREKQVEIDQLKYELGAQSRRSQLEVASLQSRVTELESLVAEARREADEYHKANIRQNQEAVALDNQLSQLKLDLAQGRPTVNFGAQELMIQQLQDEISRTQRVQASAAAVEGMALISQGEGHGVTSNRVVAELQQKLKAAARQIAKLAREKQLLIDVGNRLRAELKRNGLQLPTTKRPPDLPAATNPLATTASNRLQEQIQNKLQQLENLQYEMTKQELADDKRRSSPPRNVPAKVKAKMVDSTTDEEEERPVSILKRPTAGNMGTKVQSYEDKLDATKTSSIDTLRKRRDENQPLRGSFPRPMRGMDEPDPGPLAAQSPAPARLPGRESGDYLATMLASMSSMGGESLQDLWRMVETEGASPRPATPRESTEHSKSNSGPFAGLMFPGDKQTWGAAPPRPQSDDSWTQKGQKVALTPRPRSSPKRNPTVARTKANSKKPQIRNWNTREDGVGR